MNKTRILMTLTLALACLGIISMVTVRALTRESSEYDSLRSMNLIFSVGNDSSANGSAHNGDLTLSFGAFDHGNGNITGQATFIDNAAKTKVTIDVECLSVNGNTARVDGTVRKSTNPNFAADAGVTFIVEDNGEGENSQPDRFNPPVLGGCRGAVKVPKLLTSDSGNIQVRFVAPDKDCTKCPAGTHCGGNGECVGGGGGGGGDNSCPIGYSECGCVCVLPGEACEVCPEK